MQLMTDRTEEIRKELDDLHQSLKMSVGKAIRVGELLIEQKEFLGHGNFLPWLKSNFEMTERHAQRYMKIADHSDKTDKMSDLQSAYLLVESIEKQEKMTTEERSRSMISEYRKTGEKPEGWDRKLDYRLKKDNEGLAKQKERIENLDRERETLKEERAEREEPVSFFSDTLKAATDAIIERDQERSDWKDKIRLSDGGKVDSFLDAIVDYLETLSNDNRRIEACNNIIKVCRNISIELQKEAK